MNEDKLETTDILPVKVNIPYREKSGAILYTITLLQQIEPQRLDRFIPAVLGDLTRSQVERLIHDGQIMVNSKTVLKASMFIKAPPCEIRIFVPPPPPTELVPLKLDLDILYEDDCLVVLNKPAGLVVHPASGHPDDTLSNALVYHFDKDELSSIAGDIRLGIVHRLDKDTSGVMVVTKDDKTHLSLMEQFKGRLVKKIYVAIAVGTPKDTAGEINAPIIRHSKYRKRFTSRTYRGREAVTRYSVLAIRGNLSLIAAFPRTGRTHQIRVHLAEQLGTPIVGDETYGGKQKIKAITDPELKETAQSAPGHLLHSYKISFSHPRTKKSLSFKVEPPQLTKHLAELISGSEWETIAKIIETKA